jgi:uncharacterized membrane protein (DUF485 family)
MLVLLRLHPVGAGVTTSMGVPIGVGVIVFTIILTWIYVRRANSEFDDDRSNPQGSAEMK